MGQTRKRADASKLPVIAGTFKPSTGQNAGQREAWGNPAFEPAFTLAGEEGRAGQLQGA